MRILVVEDDPILALVTTTLLEEEGHEVSGPAYDVAEALAAVATLRPQLALMDVNLAGRDEGIALARQLLADYGISSIFVSGQVASARANQDAALGLLKKPYEPADLLGTLVVAEELLAGRTPPPPPASGSLEIFRGHD